MPLRRSRLLLLARVMRKHHPFLPRKTVFHIPYPKGYKTPNLVPFDGKKGSPKEHISRSINDLGSHAGDCNLCLKELSKSLTDRAYTWYTTLTPGSIQTRKDLVNFVKRFQDLALDCYNEKNNEALVEICINNIVADYRVYLKNIGIS
ncbi:hypothetical protein D8674_038218 [Pyrus ussuriensis x Pyrus communis]|uniref:Retrotransposon gag domain-containing protein n=1 Tax=Pyrus ussuriensis x Pyrus communis TaxID=2448454 RepID=A0A5N5I5Q6_9ROSA|nr:hypothetical protein D8674_038218 [Pyrus ussuriensis x Pyrus communis]